MKPLFKLTFLLLIAIRAYASPVVNTVTDYYTISGNNEDQLRNAMTSKSPVRQMGKIFDAHTSWHVSWRFNWATKNGKCYITNTSSTVDIKFIMPKWINRHTGSQYLINQWDRYYAALTEHEHGHKGFGVTAAEEIEKAIFNMPPSNSCKALENEANAIGDKIINKYIALEKEYDKATNYGSNNGAVFP